MSLGMFDENGIWYLNALVPVALTLTGTVEPRLSRFLDYLNSFSGSNLVMNIY